MNKGIKITLFVAIVLVVSCGLGIVSVFFVFDTISDGRYEVDRVYIDSVQYDVNHQDWQILLEDAYVFSIDGRNITTIHDNIPSQSVHRLRGSFFGNRYVEIKDTDTDEWIRYDGTEKTHYQSIRVENRQIVMRFYSQTGDLLETWYYVRI